LQVLTLAKRHVVARVLEARLEVEDGVADVELGRI
jgi:hypothetical protein